MKGIIVKDWSKIDFANPEHVRKFRGAMARFFQAPEKNPELKAAIRAFSTKSDFPAEILKVLEKFHLDAAYDTAYESLFDIRDFTDTTEPGFYLVDVQSGLTFDKVVVGDKIRVYDISGTRVSVPFDTYGGALGWERKLLDDRQYWTMEDSAIAFRNAAYRGKAQAYYALIDALPASQDVAWVAGAAQLERDIATINAAYLAIITECDNFYPDVTANTPVTLLAPLMLKERVLRAMGELSQAFSSSTKRVPFNVNLQFTTMLASQTEFYMGLPGRKSKGGNRQNLEIERAYDILALTHLVAGSMRYGAAIGEIRQLRRCYSV